MTESTKRAGISAMIVSGKAVAAVLIVVGIVNFLEFGLAVASSLPLGP
jgi:hypothetical protein